ncbi:non-specific serine/threonine protein kinase [Malassezia cuniculi]|uniref:Non-specific serine/threonine protein kinase n=1 Tax=Malassezia cuniculi TaxID=948313 RepID=A0AAF0EXK2_9BASI|nr:non-specific serine/threonine protein kinase [Malassezia cuniculi]
MDDAHRAPAPTPHRPTLAAGTMAACDSFKTPLKTPARLEQTSTTPITPFEVIETHKENVQPLSRGRSAHALSTALGMQYKERQALLSSQRDAHESVVSSAENAECDDPLDAWNSYVKWCIDSYPGGQGAESGLIPLLERVTRTFHGSEQYRNDSRYLRLWIMYAQHVDAPGDVYNFLLANEVGTRLASLYEELARFYEESGSFDRADEIYRLGIARRAAPLERLKRRYDEFQQRVVAEGDSTQPYSRQLAEAMTRAGRSVLGVKSGESSAPGNVFRARGGNPGVASTRAPSNGRVLKVYNDENDDEPPRAPASGWADLGSVEQRRQENASTLGKHHMRPIQSKTPARSSARVLEVFCDSDEEQPRRTPRKPDDVFAKSQSESDKLRKNPFMCWSKDDLGRGGPAESASASAPAPAPPTALPPKASAKASSSRHAERQRSSSSRTKASREERHVVPLTLLYPGLDMSLALDKTRALPQTAERCIEELLAERVAPPGDAWTHLDKTVGCWLPERRPRAASPTLVTRAAIAEVDSMFNGDDSESESDESSEASDQDDVQYYPKTPARLVENDVQTPCDENALPTPRNRTPFGSATPRTPLCARVEPPHARAQFQPLTPITEATEVSRLRTPLAPCHVALDEEDEEDQDTCAADDGTRHTEPAPPATPAAAASPPTGPTHTPSALRAPPSTLDIPNPCSPADPTVVAALLSNLAAPLSEAAGYIDMSDADSSYLSFAKAHARQSRRLSVADHEFEIGGAHFTLQHLLGEGGFGAVFLAEDVDGVIPLAGNVYQSEIDPDDFDAVEAARMVALKIESPPNPWEFYVLSALRERLADAQARSSIVGARQFVAMRNESILMLEYGAKGTLLDLVNAAGTAGVGSMSASASGGVDEVLAIFFAVELLRTVEAMHAVHIIHGDLKIDNCLVRLDGQDEWSSQYAADGSGGWAGKGVQLIDFGRAIDLDCYPAGQSFVCDWSPGTQDCVEMREARPWRHQADYYGIASIVHTLLFGQYMTTTRVPKDGEVRTQIQQPLRRYWQTALWGRLFDELLNPGAQGVDLGSLRRDMATWLEENSCRGGRNLKGLLKKIEIWALKR